MATENVKQESRLQKNGPVGLLLGLLDIALPELSDVDLRRLAAYDDDARNMLGHIVTVTDSIGALVSEDDKNTGCFRGRDDLPDLLMLISGYARQACALLDVAGAADCALMLRERAADGEVANG